METFVIRVWVPANDGGAPSEPVGTLHGIVEHIGSGRRTPFTGHEQLCEFIVAGLEERAINGE